MVFSSSSKVKEHERPVWNCNNGSVTPLQLACTHGHDRLEIFSLFCHFITLKAFGLTFSILIFSVVAFLLEQSGIFFKKYNFTNI